MLFLILYCGFYLSGLLLARWLTLPRQALVNGLALTAIALVAALTLWLLTRTDLTEPWLAIALAGTVALPAFMLGLGLLAGGWVRQSRLSRVAIALATIPPLAMLLVPILT